ncbi:MAG: hypothetical protein K1X81_09595, partial [Bacteroidia bacterium]|nr:hypothetical protein [Bacteroidia bacterium]
MKKFIFICTLFTGVFCHPLFAQDDSLLVDSIEPEIGIAQMFDSCYKNLNLDYATTGLLIDKAIPTINVQAYSGLTGDTILSDNFAWRRAYGTLRRAFIDSTEAFDTLEKVIGLMEAYQDSGYMPIGIINYQYNRIKLTAIEDSLIYVSGIRLFDVTGRSESPYEIKNCFMAAPYIHESDTEIITFVFNPAMYFTNDTRTLDHMEVDFGDGNGYVVVGLNSYSVIDYGETHDVIVIVKMVFTNSTTSVSSFVIRIKKQNITIGGYGGTWPDQFLTIEAESLYTGTTVKGKVHVSVRFGCSNGTDQKLRKPFIIVTGYSPPYDMDYKKNHGIPPGNGRGKLSEFYSAEENVFAKLYYQDYDMIFVEYDDPTNYVQNNAYAVEEVIKWVNEQKANNGSTHPNVIMGFSMGGIVARYALADMNAKYRANPGTVPNHDVKVFYSYDSPQAGANTPLGLQFMTVDMYKFYNQNRHIIKQAEWDDINWDYKNITCPATRQMLINYYYPSASLYTAFYSELNSLNPNATDPLKVGCKSVAISNGSGEGHYQRDELKLFEMYGSSYLIHANAGYWSSGNFFGWGIDVWGVPETSSVSNKRVYTGTLIYKAIHQNLYTISHYGNALNSHCNNIDGAPGGRGHIDYGAASNTILRLRTNAKFPAPFGYATFSNPFVFNCLVPTISAVAATYQNNYMAAINNPSVLAANPSKFNDFRTDDHPDNENATAEFNNQHVLITGNNLRLFLKDLLAEAGSTIETTKTFNYGGVTTDKIATVEVKNGAVLSINKNEQAGLTPQMSGGTNLNKNYNPDDNTHFQVYTYKFNS